MLELSSKPTTQNSVKLGISPDVGEHGLIIGLTGCGKSYLAHQLLYGHKNIVVIDPKREFELAGATIVQTPDQFIRCKRYPIIYRPIKELLASVGAYNEVYAECYQRCDKSDMKMTVYTDELACVGNANVFPPALRICYMLGRSKGLTMIGATQRPSGVPLCCLSEAKRWYVFFLNHPSDVDKIRGLCRGYPKQPTESEYIFYYYRVGSNIPASMKKIGHAG